MKAIKPKLPFLPIYLVEGQDELDKIKYLSGYTVPEMGNAAAKCCHVTHTTRETDAIIIVYPGMYEVEPITVTHTLVHEACHAWDFIKNHFGFGDDSELHAYSVESIFLQLYERYAKMYKLYKGDNDA